MSYILTHGSTIGNAKVISNEVNKAGTAIPGRALQSISYITIHNTGNVDVKANNFHRSLKSQNADKNGREASWHFSVDDIEIYQEVPMNWETWHAGDSKGNKNSISIETCMWSNKDKQRKTYENASKLVAVLMKQFNIPISNVVQHNYWSGKNCPQYLREGKHGYNWSYFIDLVKQGSGTSTGGNNSGGSSNSGYITPSEYTHIVDTDVLNVRSNRGTNYPIVGKLYKGDKVSIWNVAKDDGGMSWGSFRYSFTPDVIGYISMDYLVSSDYTHVVDADVLNVRSNRGTEYSIVGKLHKGDKISIWNIAKGKDGKNWGSFRYSFTPDIIGYVCMDYVKSK